MYIYTYMYMHPTDVHPYIHVYTLAHTPTHLDVLILLERGSTRPPCLALYTRVLREHKAPTEASDIPATQDHKYICSQKCALAWRTCVYHHDNIKW